MPRSTPLPRVVHRRRVARRATWAAALVLAGLSPHLVAATGDPRERVDTLLAEARDAVRQGDYELSVARFREALALAPDEALARFQLGRVLAALGRFDEARVEFATVVAAQPQNGAAWRGEATALLMEERYADARDELERGLNALPRDGQLAHTLARLLATAPDDQVRDGRMALALARKVYEVKQLYETAETVAMAHAEIGEYQQAIEIQQGLIAKARAAGDESRVDDLERRLASYQRSEPWRAANGAEIAMATEPPHAAAERPPGP